MCTCTNVPDQASGTQLFFFTQLFWTLGLKSWTETVTWGAGVGVTGVEQLLPQLFLSPKTWGFLLDFSQPLKSTTGGLTAQRDVGFFTQLFLGLVRFISP
jgi:hypothetical protein